MSSSGRLADDNNDDDIIMIQMASLESYIIGTLKTTAKVK